jgi:hypothetical protein
MEWKLSDYYRYRDSTNNDGRVTVRRFDNPYQQNQPLI